MISSDLANKEPHYVWTYNALFQFMAQVFASL